MSNKPADEQIKQLKAMGHDAAMKLLMLQPINMIKYRATYRGRSVDFYSDSWEPTKKEAANAIKASCESKLDWKQCPHNDVTINEVTIEPILF